MRSRFILCILAVVACLSINASAGMSPTMTRVSAKHKRLHISIGQGDSVNVSPVSINTGPDYTSTKRASTASFVDLSKTVALAKSLSKHSWEYGTTTEALLEVYHPQLTVYSKHAFPDANVPVLRNGSVSEVDGLVYARSKIQLGKATLADGEGAVGDPASLGVGALLLAASDVDDADDFKTAADSEYATILSAPRFFNGAYSQRFTVPELWADEVHMTPPFLAYYAVATQNTDILRDAVRQITLYRQVLQANTTEPWQGLWLHIVGPETQTLGVWGTGNGWMALGTARVLATIANWSACGGAWWKEQALLKGCLMEIFDGVQRGVQAEPTTGLLRNYLVGGNDSQTQTGQDWFGDGSGTAAIVAAALRLAVLDHSLAPQLIEFTKPYRAALARQTNDDTGLLAPTVNPYDWHTLTPYTAGSPEGQAFVSMAGAAWRDCITVGVCEANR